MNEPPDKPCEGCEHAPCRLPLNCARWLRYQQALRQCRADAAALRQVNLRNMDEGLLPSLNQRRRKLAEACPWVQKEEVPVGKKIDYEQVQELYNAGLNDPAIAERLGIGEMSVYRWRKKNHLPPHRRRKPPDPSKPKPPALLDEQPKPEPPPLSGASADQGEDGIPDRIRQLMALVQPGDSREARTLAARLAGQWILDKLKGADYGNAD